MSVGIKETEEVIVALQQFCVSFIVSSKKLGVIQGGVATVNQLLTSGSDLQLALAAAVDGILKVPSEIGDVDLLEGVALGRDAYTFEKAIVAAVKTV